VKKLKTVNEPHPWYSKGLNFECTGCGQCCTGSPGYVWVTREEIESIAAHLNLSIKEFSRNFLRKIEGQFSLIELLPSYDCVFLKDKKCSIYSVRPIQCRTFPWWPHLLSSESNWKGAAHGCEGICQNAPLVPLEKIEEQKLIQINYTKKRMVS
jgi:hypothetical protein